MKTTCEYAENANKRLEKIIGTLERFQSTPEIDTYIKCYLTFADLLTLKEIQQYIDILIVENNKLQRLADNLLFLQRSN